MMFDSNVKLDRRLGLERLKTAIALELEAAAAAESALDHAAATAHLERAHVLSQRITYLHVKTHVRMLLFAIRRRDWREIRGQSTRIPAALVFSRIWIPRGNTGGANVSAFLSMPIPDQLRSLLDAAYGSTTDGQV